MPYGSLSLEVLDYSVAAATLEVERAFLPSWIQLTVYKDAGIEVVLRQGAQHFVLRHDSYVGVGDQSEVFVRRVPVSVHFVVHC